MLTIRRLFVLLTLSIYFPLYVNAQAFMATLDLEVIYESLPEYQLLLMDMEAYNQKLMQRVRDQIIEQQNTITIIHDGLIAHDRLQSLELEAELNQMQREIDEATSKLERKLEEKHKELLAPIQIWIEREIEFYRIEKGYQLIIYQSFKKGRLPIILYSEAEIPDITMEILARLHG